MADRDYKTAASAYAALWKDGAGPAPDASAAVAAPAADAALAPVTSMPLPDFQRMVGGAYVPMSALNFIKRVGAGSFATGERGRNKGACGAGETGGCGRVPAAAVGGPRCVQGVWVYVQGAGVRGRSGEGQGERRRRPTPDPRPRTFLGRLLPLAHLMIPPFFPQHPPTSPPQSRSPTTPPPTPPARTTATCSST
jgi:hypothetical protein